MILTSTWHLRKPELGDQADIRILNENMDIIEAALNQKVSTSKTYTSAEISVVDSAGHYSSTQVEGVLGEIGDNINQIEASIIGVVAGEFPPFTAANLPILDTANYYTTDEVESALAQNGYDIVDIKNYIGYVPLNVFGVEADFQNNIFTRIGGAVGKSAGVDFDSINAFGGRKRCNVTNSGKVIAYYGDAGYTETGSTTIEIIKDEITYPIGTIVQVMVEQPKFYYKVVPLKLEKITDTQEVNTFTITAPCTTNGDVTITLNGRSYTAAVLSTDNTTALVATKLRSYTYDGWIVSGSGSTVVFTSVNGGAKTTGTFSGGGTGVTATIAKTIAGSVGIGYKLRKARYYISDVPMSGFNLHPAFMRNSVEKNYIYPSAYEGSLYDTSTLAYILDDAQIADFTATTGDKLSSIANAKPISGLTQNLTRANTRILASNRGIGWQQLDVLTASATMMLMLVEYAGFNMQTAIGLGVVSKPSGAVNESELTGMTSSFGNSSGMATGSNGFVSVTYRGEENPWGNIWKFVDGLNIYAYGLHQAYYSDHGYQDNINTSPYKNAGFTLAKSNGYTSAFGWSETCDFLFLPTETIGSSSLPVGDYFYQNHADSAFLVARLGGYWYDGSRAGAFGWAVYNSSSHRYRYIGGRSVYIP